MDCESMLPDTSGPSQLQVVDYSKTLQHQDPTAAPVKQAKIALDGAIASDSIQQLQEVLQQVGQLLPHDSITLMMHVLRSVAMKGNLEMMRFALEQIRTCQPEQVFELMKYGLDGAATLNTTAMMDFILAAVQEAFQANYEQQFLGLLQHAVNATATRGNLGVLKFLMDHTAAASIPINYDTVFRRAAAAGHAETLLTEAIRGGAHYENVILMLLQSAQLLPDNNDSQVGSRQSFKNTAKVQLVKCYKQKDPMLFAKLMAAIKSYFPEEATHARNGDVDM